MSTFYIKKAVQVKYLEVDAGVRYWEDATLNGEEDTEGNIPLRNGDYWQPIINLETGQIIDWPEGIAAKIHYKVCDDGNYWLLDADKNRVAKWNGYYVPNSLLCINDNGFGDYIIFEVDANGLIVDWKTPNIVNEEWEPTNKAPIKE